MRYGMIIDLKRCYGCHSCTIICKQKNATPPDIFWTKVIASEVGEYPNAHREFKPTQCMHCADAPCVDACAYNATTKRADGIVEINRNICIGCLYCIAACPYDARCFDFGDKKTYFPGKEETAYEKIHELSHRPRAVSKCNFCSDRLAAGDVPACVQVCPTKARTFGDLDSTEMKELIRDRGGFQEKPEKGANPSLYYLR